jgi:hypothetical protein
MLESAGLTKQVLGSLPESPAPPRSAVEVTGESMDRDAPPTAEAYAFEQLADAIKQSIDPPSWQVTEGEGGDMRYWAGRVIVVQTLENHERIETFLRELRAKMHQPPAAQSGTASRGQ